MTDITPRKLLLNAYVYAVLFFILAPIIVILPMAFSETDYLTFARQLADAGIETWLMDPRARTCTFCCRAGEKLFSAPL